MSFDVIMFIVGLILLVGSFVWALWPGYRRRRTWEQEFDSALRNARQAASERNDDKFSEALERLRRLSGLPQPPDEP